MSDMAPLLRQWTLLRLLAVRRQGMTLKALSSETGVSLKTVQRDLNLLRRLAFKPRLCQQKPRDGGV